MLGSVDEHTSSDMLSEYSLFCQVFQTATTDRKLKGVDSESELNYTNIVHAIGQLHHTSNTTQ